MKKSILSLIILAPFNAFAGGMIGGAGSPQNFSGGGTGVIGTPDINGTNGAIYLTEGEFRVALRQALTTGTITREEVYHVKGLSLDNKAIHAANDHGAITFTQQ